MVNRKGGRVLWFREKLTQLAETRREKMIDEKMRLHPSLEKDEKKLDFAVTNTANESPEI